MTDFDERIAEAVGSTPTDRVELDGGMIGTVYRVDLADGRRLVAKVGDTPLSVEAAMLRYLATESDLPVPEVFHASDDLLVIEYVDGESQITPAVERDAADHLAALHGVTADAFGFERDTLTGPVRQPNPWTDSWTDFFRDERIRHVADLGRADGSLPPSLADRVESFAADLDALLVEPESPSLIHGDAWRTNILVRDGRVTAFLDPAVYYAHPEVELAYIDWTGTFGEVFFDRYRDHRSIADGFFSRRRHAYAVYPLLVHVYLFGGQYVGSLQRTLGSVGY